MERSTQEFRPRIVLDSICHLGRSKRLPTCIRTANASRRQNVAIPSAARVLRFGRTPSRRGDGLRGRNLHISVEGAVSKTA